MPSPPVLDIEPLLAPIDGDDPSGNTVPYAVRDALEQARKEINPEDFDPSDPLRPAEAKHADWAAIIEKAGRTLSDTSKDLMVAARLTEALTKVYGFAGLRDGFRLLRRMVDEGWDRIRPLIEEPDDLEARAAAFHWLDDPDRGSRFPLSVRQVPMIVGPKGAMCWMDWNHSRTGQGQIKPEDFEQGVASTPREACQLVLDDLDETIGEIQRLLEALNARMNQAAPGLTSLRQAVFECRTLAQQVMGRKGPAPVEPGEAPSEEAQGTPAEGGGPSVGRAMASRAQVYQRLAEAADVLERLEPHSPIPYLIRRAVQLGELSFPELIKALITDAGVLGDLSRNLGIQELQE